MMPSVGAMIVLCGRCLAAGLKLGCLAVVVPLKLRCLPGE